MEEKRIRDKSYNLRDYQSEYLSAIYRQYKAGLRRQLTCLPTGSGKTVIFSEFPKFFRMKKQMLVLAHRAELLDQARDKLHNANPGLRIEIEQAGRSADPECDVVVASVPTLGRKGSKRLKHLDPDRFFLIVVDDSKLVARLGRGPLPVEIVPFESEVQVRWLGTLGCRAELWHEADGSLVVTDNGNYLARCWFPEGIDDAYALARTLADRPGIVEHGLFLDMAAAVVVASAEGVRVLERAA